MSTRTPKQWNAIVEGLRDKLGDAASAAARLEREATQKYETLQRENLTLRQQADGNTARMNAMADHIHLIEHQLSIVRQTTTTIYAFPGLSRVHQGGYPVDAKTLERPR